jgi:hypothetical protein
MGRLLLVDHAAGIRAASFDAAHPARTSADTSVLANVYYEEREARGWLAVSNTGTAIYASGDPAKTSLVWVDREGKSESLGKDEDVYRELILSPDGTKAAVRNGYDLWIHDLQRGTRSRLTSGAPTFVRCGALTERRSFSPRIAEAAGTSTHNPLTDLAPRSRCSNGPTTSSRSRFWPMGPCSTLNLTPKLARIFGR